MLKPGDLVYKVFIRTHIGKEEICYEEIPGICMVLKSYLGSGERELMLFSLNLAERISTPEYLTTKVGDLNQEEVFEPLDTNEAGIFIPIPETGDFFNAKTRRLVRVRKNAVDIDVEP